MEQLLKLLKSLKFLEAVCYIVAAIVLVVAPEHAINAAVLLAAAVAVLKAIGIGPEGEVKALLAASKLVKNKKK